MRRSVQKVARDCRARGERRDDRQVGQSCPVFPPARAVGVAALPCPGGKGAWRGRRHRSSLNSDDDKFLKLLYGWIKPRKLFSFPPSATGCLCRLQADKHDVHLLPKQRHEKVSALHLPAVLPLPSFPIVSSPVRAVHVIAPW